MSLKKAGLLFLLAALLCCISYFYFDRQLADAMHAANSRQYHFLHYLQQLPEPLLFIAPLGIIFYFVQHVRKHKNKFARFSLLASAAVLLATGLKLALKFCFGRYWPDTFKENNLSYVRDGVYGFEPFHWGVQYQSFPSGHMMTIVAFSYIVTRFYPNLKWACVSACCVVALSLLILYYHFLGDVIAGSVIGFMVTDLVFSRSAKRLEN